MILVITPEINVFNETEQINHMFQEGLDLLHIRKPHIIQKDMDAFIRKINSSFHSRLVLHNHYDLGKEYGISRFHFREQDRKEGQYKPFTEKNMISTSVHHMTTYNSLEKEWEYAFISPFSPSISKKGYGKNSTVMDDMKYKNNPDVKLIALGGIDVENVRKVFDTGADGAALLGSVWENDEPLKAFMKIRNALYL